MVTLFFLLTTFAFFGSVATLVAATLAGTRGLVLSERSESLRIIA